MSLSIDRPPLPCVLSESLRSVGTSTAEDISKEMMHETARCANEFRRWIRNGFFPSFPASLILMNSKRNQKQQNIRSIIPLYQLKHNARAVVIVRR